MSEWDDVEIDQLPQDSGPRRPGLLPIAVVVALLVGGLAFYFLYWKNRSTPEPTEMAETTAAPEPVEIVEEPEGEPDIELPPLGESDALLRELIGRLSSHPRLAAWLVNKDLVRRFTMIVDNIAEGVSPRAHLLFLEPEKEFLAIERADGFYIDPESYDRYNMVADVFVSLDTAGSVELYRTVKPLIDEAFRELGRPDETFDETLSLALEQLLETPVPEGRVELIPRFVSYHLADSRLESLTPAQKHFFRMGPRNVRKVQQKLRELSRGLGS
jgi:hypothetical protein